MNYTVKNQRGVIALLTLLTIAAFSLAVISTAAVLATDELRMANSGGVMDTTYYATESGINAGIYRLILDPNPGATPYVLTINNVTVTITSVVNPDNPFQRIVTSRGTDRFGNVRTITVIADTSSFGGGFNYAVQSTGNIEMEGGSKIIGNAYSNSAITFQSGSNATITGQAYYQTIDPNIMVNGGACPNPNCHPGAEIKPLPLGDAAIAIWKNEITTTLALNCRQAPGPGPNDAYCVTGSQTLGQQKIDGLLRIANNATLTLSGNIWVTGNITFDNNTTILLDSSLGSSSAVMITDGVIDLGNNVSVCPTTPSPTCNAKSFVILLSTNPSINASSPAIYASNNSSSIIFAAPHGMLRVKNGGQLNAAASNILHLEPNSTVTFNSSLASFFVNDGGGGNIATTSPGTWQEK